MPIQFFEKDDILFLFDISDYNNSYVIYLA